MIERPLPKKKILKKMIERLFDTSKGLVVLLLSMNILFNHYVPVQNPCEVCAPVKYNIRPQIIQIV